MSDYLVQVESFSQSNMYRTYMSEPNKKIQQRIRYYMRYRNSFDSKKKRCASDINGANRNYHRKFVQTVGSNETWGGLVNTRAHKFNICCFLIYKLYQVIVGGGGGRNVYLMERILFHLKESFGEEVRLLLNEDIGINR